MWQKIIIGILAAVAVFYIVKRIFKTTVKGEVGHCADCPPAEEAKQKK
jgi:hypothetical protein